MPESRNECTESGRIQHSNVNEYSGSSGNSFLTSIDEFVSSEQLLTRSHVATPYTDQMFYVMSNNRKYEEKTNKVIIMYTHVAYDFGHDTDIH